MNYKDLEKAYVENAKKERHYELEVIRVYEKIVDSIKIRLNSDKCNILHYLPVDVNKRIKDKIYNAQECIEYNENGWVALALSVTLDPKEEFVNPARFIFTFSLRKNDEEWSFKGFKDESTIKFKEPISTTTLDDIYNRLFDVLINKLKTLFDSWLAGEKRKIGFDIEIVERQ